MANTYLRIAAYDVPSSGVRACARLVGRAASAVSRGTRTLVFESTSKDKGSSACDDTGGVRAVVAPRVRIAKGEVGDAVRHVGGLCVEVVSMQHI